MIVTKAFIKTILAETITQLSNDCTGWNCSQRFPSHL